MKSILLQERMALAISAALAFLANLLSLVPYYAVYRVAILVNDGRLSHAALWTFITLAFAAILGRATLSAASTSLSHRAAYRALHDLRLVLIERLDGVSLGFFAKRSTAELKKIISEDVEQVEEVLAHAVPDIVSAIAVPLTAGLFLAFFDWRLALAALAMFPLIVGLYPLSLVMARNEVAGYFAGSVALRAAVVEFLRGMKVIRSFVGGQGAFRRLDEAISGMADATYRMSVAAALPSALMMAALRANVLVVLPTGGLLYLSGGIDLPTLILFLLLGLGVNASVYKLLYTAGSFAMRMQTAGANIRSILDAEQMEVQGSGVEIPTRHDIAFDNVSFAYGENGRGVRGADFRVDAGELVAIVGPSGSGKTTLAYLAGRFWDVDRGAVAVGGVDIRRIDRQSLSAMTSFILQDAYLLNDTIAGNIRAGRPEASDAEVEEAARRALVLDFALELERGLDTPVGEGGRLLSGGQRQRVAIARAILRAAPVVIMDEATSALDPDSEAEVLAALRELSKGRTVIAIAHRVDTIRHADRILFMREGEIVASGRHETLLKESPDYARLYEQYAAADGWSLAKGCAAGSPEIAAEAEQKPFEDTAQPALDIPEEGGTLRTALALAGPMRRELFGRALPLLVLEALMMGAPVIAVLMLMLDVISGELTQQRIWLYAAVVLGLFTLQVLCNLVANRSLWKVQTGVVAALQRRLSDHLAHIPLGQLTRRDTGALETLLTQHTTELNYVTPAMQLVRSLVAPVISLILMALLDWRMALAIVATVPVFMLVVAWSDRVAVGVWQRMVLAREELSARIMDYLQSIPTFRSLGLEGRVSAPLRESLAGHRDISLSTVTRVAPTVGLGQAVLEAGFCVLLGVGGTLAISGRIDSAVLLVFMVIGLFFYGPLGDAFELTFYRRQQERAFARIREILAMERLSEPHAVGKPHDTGIEFERVSFSYDRALPALRLASFVLPAGGLYAWWGHRGRESPRC
ncbi:ABC transporter [Nitratireductor aquibiodomus RA22]|uniref:ABC transporter n=1 Tax=Nitratireductor aquibiodomus RA22 TaxID=1189611 RepID=I5C5C1_9HYPH|nr:ABC transporter ATP-binding protein [Nitratireductor aquibiodomus]EIM77023.1 ABC transporter [Nitratireductor aquibiodomus RA22]